MFVHLAFLTGFGNRLTTLLRWLRSMIGRGRAEREFSTAHTGGDLSLPAGARRAVQPTLFPVIEGAGSSGGTGPAEPRDESEESSSGKGRR
jgi:hypothetical protein